jgi:hypothetical protein
VFNQSYKTDNNHALDYADETTDPLVERMVNRLTRAIADEDMRRVMNIEDEIDREYQEYGDIIGQKNQEIEQKDQAIAQPKKSRSTGNGHFGV